MTGEEAQGDRPSLSAVPWLTHVMRGLRCCHEHPGMRSSTIRGGTVASGPVRHWAAIGQGLHKMEHVAEQPARCRPAACPEFQGTAKFAGRNEVVNRRLFKCEYFADLAYLDELGRTAVLGKVQRGGWDVR